MPSPSIRFWTSTIASGLPARRAKMPSRRTVPEVMRLEDLALLSTISTVAGNSLSGFVGDGGPATAAKLNSPNGVAVDSAGNLFISDTNNNVIREVIKSTGVITTVAGNNTSGFTGDGGPATAARLNQPEGIAVDSAGNIFIADLSNNVIREVNKATGQISTVAGNSTSGFGGDGGPATAAKLNSPDDVAVDSSGNIFIADTGNNVIREVIKSTGVISTIAGNTTSGFAGDGGPATAARLKSPQGLAVDSAGNVFIADSNNNVIREVTKATGQISTVAGNSTSGFAGDGGPATAAKLNFPDAVKVDSSGNIFIADASNNVIREVTKATGQISTVAGNTTSAFSGDGGPATAAALNFPSGLAIDTAGDVFVADTGNNVIRELPLLAAKATTPTPTPTPTPSPTPTPTPTGTPAQVTGIVGQKTKKGLTGFTVSFSQGLNSATAHNLGLYHVLAGAKKKGKSAFTKPLAISSVSVNGSGNTVTITLAKPHKGAVEVEVQGTLVSSSGASSNANFSQVAH
jgi:sugar lactone lactonase YvrE